MNLSKFTELDRSDIILGFSKFLLIADEQGWSEEELYYFAKLTLALYEDALKS